MHEPAHVGDHVLHVPLSARAMRLAACRVLVDEQPGGLELVDDAAQGRTEPVVEVAPDPAALLLAGDDEPLAAVLELVGELAGPRGLAACRTRSASSCSSRRRSRLRNPRTGSTTRPTSWSR